MSWLELVALLFTLSALFGWLNLRLLHMPHTVGLLIMGLAASLLLVLVNLIWPGMELYRQLHRVLAQIDFTKLVMDGMLAFLLFAGALNVNIAQLRERMWPVIMLALVGTVVSTLVVAFAFWALAQLLGYPLSLAWSLVFGALISPTDPIAVLSMMKNARSPEKLRTETEGEALFNDGIGVLLFTLLLGLASNTGPGELHVGSALAHLAWETGGGLGLGACAGYLAYRMMRAIDDFPVEVLITLALVSGTYALAHALGMSGPLAVVAAGLFTGHRTRHEAMGDETRGYVNGLWTVIDEVLNSILFLLIGLEVIVLQFRPSIVTLALTAIPVVLVARLAAVSAPLLILKRSSLVSARHVPFLTWAGIHGGISVALALSLPPGEQRPVILAATYAVVLFTLTVQGPTLGWMARRTLAMPNGDAEPS